MLTEISEDKLELDRKTFAKPINILNKIQIFASKYALNRCREDMNELSKLGIVCVQYNCYEYNEDYSTLFQVTVIPRESIREIRKKDYMLNPYMYHSHLFFEIPVINNFTDRQMMNWQNYCLKTLAKTAIFNKKKAAQWLRMKKVASDFDD